MIASITGALVVVAGVLLLKGTFSSSMPSRQPGSSLVAADKSGDEWFLELASGPSRPISADGSTRAGGPLLVKTDVQIVGRDVSIGLILQGQAGETYVPVVHKNAQPLPAPGLKILDETGKTLAAGTFRYG